MDFRVGKMLCRKIWLNLGDVKEIEYPGMFEIRLKI